MSFGKWLAESRNAARLTQSQLAERAGISPNYVSALERDEPNARDGSPRRPRIDKVDRIAKALGVNGNEARLAAGYAPNMATHEVNGFRIDLPDDVYGFIPYNPEIIRTQEEADAFKESFLVTYEIIKRRVIEERRKKESE